MGSIAPFIRIVITRNQSSSFCKASLIKLAGKVSSDRKNEISKLVNNNTINETNFKSSYGKLKRELEAKENE